MSIYDALPERRGISPVWEGKIAKTLTALDQLASVIIPDIDRNMRIEGAMWMPRDAALTAQPQPHCELERTTDYGIPHGGWTAVPWNGEISDPMNMHAANSNDIIIPQAGRYVIWSVCAWNVNNLGIHRLQSIMVNSRRVAATGRQAGSSGITGWATGMERFFGAIVRTLAANDQIRMEVYQDTGVVWPVVATASEEHTSFGCTKLDWVAPVINHSFPTKGDPCLVIFDNDNRPWITVWWPYAS
jgi:hypothetical protein